MSVSGRLKWAALALAAAVVGGLAGCESMPGSPSQGGVEGSVSSGTVQGEVGDPRNRARVHTELAALYFQRGNMAVALEELRIATESDPNYPTAHSMFGLVYMELREPKMAQQSFERAIRLSPNDPDINHNYGRFLCQTGRENEHRDEQNRDEHRAEPRSQLQRPPPRVQLSHARPAPDPLRIPESSRSVDGRQRRAARADAVSRNQIDFDAGFLQRPEHPRVVGAVRTGSGQNKRGAARG